MGYVDMQKIFEEVLAVTPNAIQTWLVDELSDPYCQFDSVRNLIQHLEMASCAAGSWSGLIYTRDIQDKLSDQDWRNAIDQAVEEYQDATGESYSVDSAYALESLVTFAVDWFAQDLASKIQSESDWNGPVYIVTIAEDSLDPSPEKFAVFGESAATELAQQLVDEKLQLVGPEQDLQEIEESLWQLVTIEAE